MLTLTLQIERAKKKLSDAKRLVQGQSGQLRPAWEAAGMSLLADVWTSYKVKAAGGTDEAGISWQPNSRVTLLLRRGPKISSWADLASQPTQIGQEAGNLFGSLTYGQPGNVFDLKDTGVVVGTNVEYARQFQEGGPTDAAGFIMHGDRYERVRRRVKKPRRLNKRQRAGIREAGGSTGSVAAAIRAGKSARTVDPQKDLREFNRSVFGILFGMEARGSVPEQPARPIVPEKSKVPQTWIKRASSEFFDALKIICKQLGLS